MRSGFSEIGEVMGEENTRRIEIKWKRDPKQKKIESLMYDYYFPSGIGQFGDSNPEVGIANQMKKIREDLRGLGSAGSPLKVDAHIWKK